MASMFTVGENVRQETSKQQQAEQTILIKHGQANSSVLKMETIFSSETSYDVNPDYTALQLRRHTHIMITFAINMKVRSLSLHTGLANIRYVGTDLC
jgi:hypothetical protein